MGKSSLFVSSLVSLALVATARAEQSPVSQYILTQQAERPAALLQQILEAEDTAYGQHAKTAQADIQEIDALIKANNDRYEAASANGVPSTNLIREVESENAKLQRQRVEELQKVRKANLTYVDRAFARIGEHDDIGKTSLDGMLEGLEHSYHVALVAEDPNGFYNFRGWDVDVPALLKDVIDPEDVKAQGILLDYMAQAEPIIERIYVEPKQRDTWTASKGRLRTLNLQTMRRLQNHAEKNNDTNQAEAIKVITTTKMYGISIVQLAQAANAVANHYAGQIEGQAYRGETVGAQELLTDAEEVLTDMQQRLEKEMGLYDRICNVNHKPPTGMTRTQELARQTGSIREYQSQIAQRLQETD